jgi:hypothetical protein
LEPQAAVIFPKGKKPPLPEKEPINRGALEERETVKVKSGCRLARPGRFPHFVA